MPCFHESTLNIIPNNWTTTKYWKFFWCENSNCSDLLEEDDVPEEELEGSGTVSTIIGSNTEESGSINVMKILEEERYCMERRLDLITKVWWLQYIVAIIIANDVVTRVLCQISWRVLNHGWRHGDLLFYSCKRCTFCSCTCMHAWTWSGALTEPVFTHEF